MIRKLAFALAATVALGAASLAASTPAAAWHGHGGWHGHYHGGFWRGGYARFYGGPAYAGGCYVRRVVGTPWGPRLRWVNVCY